MRILIDKNSNVPLYKQIVSCVRKAECSNEAKPGEPMPSLNAVAAQFDISMETVKKAYEILKKENVIRGRQGKGFFINERAQNAPKRIIMFVDKLSAYKLAICKGLTDNMKSEFNLTIRVHNKDLALFDIMISEAIGEYDYYIVAPHFDSCVSGARIVKSLKRLPYERMILIDRDIPELKGNIGRIWQDFAGDACSALEKEIQKVGKYERVIVLDPGNSLYASQMAPKIKALLDKNGMDCRVCRGFQSEMMTPGTLFIVLGGQMDTDHYAVLSEVIKRGYTLGDSIGMITYNDEPVNEFICGGLASLTTDFAAMGRHAAEMIESGTQANIHNEFSLIARASF